MPGDGARLTIAGKLFVLLFLVACGYGAYRLFSKEPQAQAVNGGGGGDPAGGARTNNSGAAANYGGMIEIGIAYGTEKTYWLEPAVRQFGETAAGKRIKINLIPKGSVDGAMAIAEEKDPHIHVWSPASSVYKDTFVQKWQTENAGQNPIWKEDNLALSPMVFVMWDERYQGFVKKYGEVSFDTIGQALAEPGGWKVIADQPDWGLFKFGHTQPSESNSGLVTLLLMAYDFNQKTRNLEQGDLLSAKFQTWLADVENATSGMAKSTGPMMKDMVLYGPSKYDALCVYESVVIDYLKQAENRGWGTLHVAYPKRNLWNENPYYILNVPWSDQAHREAAATFLEFLMSEPVQKDALQHGFRPGNPSVGLKDADSPFVLYEKMGLKIDLLPSCEPPKAEVIDTLLQIWNRKVKKK